MGCRSSSLNYERKLNRYRFFPELKVGNYPICYSRDYDIQMFGLERLQLFDTLKWRKVFQGLLEKNMFKENQVVQPFEVTKDELLLIHSNEYLESLQHRHKLSSLIEYCPLNLIPFCISDSKILKPLRFHCGGTIMAAKLAIDYGWAINIGGGFHHAYKDDGGGFCIYADISLAIKCMILHGYATKFMVIDLDAHQCNGVERDFSSNPNVYFLDIYNCDIYPGDHLAKSAINRKVELNVHSGDKEYMRAINKNLHIAMNEFKADLILYNAGTDVLVNDPLGYFKISMEAVIKRDEMVFKIARKFDTPIMMVLGGGYQTDSVACVIKSILNLWTRKIIFAIGTENIDLNLSDDYLSDETPPPDLSIPTVYIKTKPKKKKHARKFESKSIRTEAASTVASFAPYKHATSYVTTEENASSTTINSLKAEPKIMNDEGYQISFSKRKISKVTIIKKKAKKKNKKSKFNKSLKKHLDNLSNNSNETTELSNILKKNHDFTNLETAVNLFANGKTKRIQKH